MIDDLHAFGSEIHMKKILNHSAGRPDIAIVSSNNVGMIVEMKYNHIQPAGSNECEIIEHAKSYLPVFK